MRMRLTPEEAKFRAEMKAFFENEIPAEIRERARRGETREPDDIVAVQRILNAHGIAVPNWPVEWGGKDWSAVQRHIYLDEMNLAHVPEPLTFNVDMVGPVIAKFGDEDLKRRFLPATANLDIWWCQGFSEPDAGSDLASLRTQAVLDGDEFVVNGQKAWTTQAQHADWMFALVRTDPDAPKRQAGISFLLIDMSSPGVQVRPTKLLDGGHEVNEVFLTDVRVPAENLVGELNAGWSYAKFLLANERTRVTRVGLTKNRLARAKRLAAETPLGKGVLLDDPLFRARLAELENQLLALELTQFRATSQVEAGGPAEVASVLKLRGSELQEQATELLVDVAGPRALAADGPEDVVPDWAQRSVGEYLTYRKVGIYGGSSEIQRTLIASTILGL
ncbi:alkylation response protein AidB-like acyl-CoA dehydrogenase [Actinomadura hallensis]|uniref:Alkylation response protein AidB-like acyl-CoA dehydrogenase n=1 Tax=Actinomadura hallensis TaxID=337895 RepID=A0A543IGB8_9ACTN|nr:acyl-CoA dehydrogenase family protein [Actinomadura hallensis]TQM69632.1 alkylation response protein AidB-like acyl-CoA dehydrogenase [Actinomadura hallensis]